LIITLAAWSCHCAGAITTNVILHYSLATPNICYRQLQRQFIDYTRKAFQLTEDLTAQKLTFEEKLDALRAKHAADTQAKNERLRLLERSP